MKGIFIILDGIADLPCQELQQQTPLEAAKTPNLDNLAQHSELAHCFPIREGVIPQSSGAVVSLFANDPNLAPRGTLEAQGANIPLKNGDLAIRTNFATIDNLNDLNLLDRRAGRTLSTKEAKILAKAINKEVKLPYPFEFHATVQHRGVLVIRGGFSDNITNIDPGYGRGIVVSQNEDKVHLSHPMDDDEDSKLAADLVNSFFRKSHEILDKHPINIKRAKKGIYAANALLLRDAGNQPLELKKPTGSWLALGYMPLEIGIAKSLNFDLYKFKYPKLKSEVYKNLYHGLERAIKYAIKMLKKNKDKYDYFYIHFKETDVPGHDDRPLEKVKMLELLDKRFFSFLKNFIKDEKLIITSDHTTACKLKAHSSDPVPVLIYPSNLKIKNSNQRFTEAQGLQGEKILGKNLLKDHLL